MNSNDIQTVLKQIGDVNLSQSHKRHYTVQKPTLIKLMNHNITPAVFKDGTRHLGKDNVDRILNYMLIDHDGLVGDYIILRMKLMKAGISHIAWASPSRKSKQANDLHKTRIIIPTIGLTKGMYAKQFLQFLIEMGEEITIETDETAQEITRFFYPPCMTNIQEPKIKKDGKWIVLTPKPRDQDMNYALASVEVFAGKPYKAKKRFTQTMTAVIEEKQSYAHSDKQDVYFPDEMMITHLGDPIGTFKELVEWDTHSRCDCPFEGEHSEGTTSEDRAFFSNGHIICTSNTHGDLIGRLASDESQMLDLEIDGEEW